MRLLRKHPLTLALRARRADDKVVAALSPPAGRGGNPRHNFLRTALRKGGKVGGYAARASKSILGSIQL